MPNLVYHCQIIGGLGHIQFEIKDKIPDGSHLRVGLPIGIGGGDCLAVLHRPAVGFQRRLNRILNRYVHALVGRGGAVFAHGNIRQGGKIRYLGMNGIQLSFLRIGILQVKHNIPIHRDP